MDAFIEDTLEIPQEFEFPFKPYDIQTEFMQNLYHVIETRKLGIFESPTGTGKSLSIICGAIKWLKDHNKFIRSQINKEITKLEEATAKLSTNDDWFTSQTKEIELNRKLDDLKIEQKKIIAYDEKIEKIISVKGNNFKQKSKLLKGLDSQELNKNEEKNVEEDDIILDDDPHNAPDEYDNQEENEEQYKPVKIYICSRTHSQLSQFVGEIIKSPFAKNIRVATLASRQNYCINPEVTCLKNMALINEKCLDMQKPTSKTTKQDEGKTIKKQKQSSATARCPYYKPEAIEELKNWTLTEVQDVEDLIASGKELNACPYYGSRRAAEDAEIILLPYNTLLHKATREASGIILKDNVVIIDEAHNLLEAMAQMYNSEVNLNQLKHAVHQLKCYKKRFSTRFSAKNLLSINQLTFVVNKLLEFLEKGIDCLKESKIDISQIGSFMFDAEISKYNISEIIKFCKDTRIAQKIRIYSIKYPLEEATNVQTAKKGVKDFLASIENKKPVNVKVEPQKSEKKNEERSVPPPSNPLLAVISFLECLRCDSKDGRILITKSVDKLQSKLQFLLLNPSSNFSDVVKEARSVIVAGGTMKPNDEFRDRLFVGSGADPKRILEFSCDHIIPPENILPLILSKGPKQENLLFNLERRFNMSNAIKSILEDTCKRVRGGIVVFFPSYKYENWAWQQVKDANFGRPVFREPQTGKSGGTVEQVLQKYADAIKRSSSRGALMFSVVGGKLSEGLNFSDDLGRCVIVIGLPYANIMATDLKEKMAYLDKTEGSGSGQKFYENMCMKAVNQCIGRAVRHKDDYATVLLVDERFNRSSTKSSLPGWIKRSLRTPNGYQECFKFINEFFQHKKTSI